MGGAYHGAVIGEMQVFSRFLPVRSTFNRKGCSFLHPFLFVRLIKARNCLRPQDIKKDTTISFSISSTISIPLGISQQIEKCEGRDADQLFAIWGMM